MLKIDKLNTGYGKKPVIFDLSLEVRDKEIVALIGPNGSGKSTVLKAISGILPVWTGNILFDGQSVTGRSVSRNIARGMTYCPQGNRVFDELSVRENLEIGGFGYSREKTEARIEEILPLFPLLKKRPNQIAGTLSGGEQQMLALARALIPEPKLLLLDEPSLGLAPNLLDDVFEKLTEINKSLGLSVLIVEQKVMKVLDISQRVYSIKLGRIAFDGRPASLRENREKLKELFL